jgi:histidinol-phosphatase (PHP family)
VRSAIAQGLTTVALTEHMPLPTEIDRDATFAMLQKNVPEYLEQVREAQAKYPQIEVICGIEIDWREGAEDYILERLGSGPLGPGALGPYEILLGSVHMLSKADGSFWEFDYPPSVEGWRERGEEGVWARYLELWRDAVNSAVPFTVMTHPDLPKKLGFKPTFDTREYYATMAQLAAAKDVLIEVNTSGLHKPAGEMYPAPALLKAFCEAGVGCTVSSDAHAPSQVGRDLDLAYAAMAAAGYKHVTVPTRTGDRRLIPLG